MPHIQLEDDHPGIRGLVAYRPDTGRLLYELPEALLRSESTLSEADVARARAVGASDMEIPDAVLIAALFCLYNRYVDGLGAVTPTDPGYYRGLADRIVHRGYLRPPGGFAVSSSDPTQE